MFTGLVSAMGEVVEAVPSGAGRDARFAVRTPPGWLADAQIGASISCNGCCLTAVSLADDRFVLEVSAETLSLTTLGDWIPGRRINLERSLRVGDELGGHLVSGHVDAVGALAASTPERGSLRLAFTIPAALARFVARKGSIAVDGVSLTVNAVDGDGFAVNVIPHTAAATTLGALSPGDRVNVEIDTLARYVARLVDTADDAAPGPRGVASA